MVTLEEVDAVLDKEYGSKNADKKADEMADRMEAMLEQIKGVQETLGVINKNAKSLTWDDVLADSTKYEAWLKQEQSNGRM